MTDAGGFSAAEIALRYFAIDYSNRPKWACLCTETAASAALRVHFNQTLGQLPYRSKWTREGTRGVRALMASDSDIRGGFRPNHVDT